MEIKTKYKIGDELFTGEMDGIRYPFTVKEIVISVGGIKYIDFNRSELGEEELLTKNEFLDLQIKDLELRIEHFKKQKD